MRGLDAYRFPREVECAPFLIEGEHLRGWINHNPFMVDFMAWNGVYSLILATLQLQVDLLGHALQGKTGHNGRNDGEFP